METQLTTLYHGPVLAQTMDDCRFHSNTNFVFISDGQRGVVKECKLCLDQRRLDDDDGM